MVTAGSKLPPDLRGDAAQFEIAVALAGKSESQNRHVVDGARLHQRLRSTRRDQVEVGVQLLVQPHDARLFILAHQKAHHRHGHAGAGRRVDILHTGDLPQQFLHRLGDPLFDFARGSAGHAYEHVDHRDDDLWFLLAGQFPHGESAHQQ